eukprot:TRINITY_DN6566_c0_g1_i1.p1 TRINITY_DN6566_c0_g1~~TRINITY_DN6566_c0_g1_i1.p1  ORF type:complete len:267 (+),score=79.22 TRINITY_DN6566_c0_g1_i1:53-853(+)
MSSSPSASVVDRLLGTFCSCFLGSRQRSYHMTSRDSSELKPLEADEEEEWDDWAQPAKPVSPEPARTSFAKDPSRPVVASLPTTASNVQFQEADDSDIDLDDDDDDDEFGEYENDDLQALDFSSALISKETPQQTHITPKIDRSFVESPTVPPSSALNSIGRLHGIPSADVTSTQATNIPLSAVVSGLKSSTTASKIPPPPAQPKLLLGTQEDVVASDDVDIFSELGMEPEIKAPKVVHTPAIKKEQFSTALSAPEDLDGTTGWDD